MELAGQRAFDARVGVGHRHEAQLFDRRLALAAVAAGRLLARAYLSKRVSSTYWSGLRSLNRVGPRADELAQRLWRSSPWP